MHAEDGFTVREEPNLKLWVSDSMTEGAVWLSLQGEKSTTSLWDCFIAWIALFQPSKQQLRPKLYKESAHLHVVSYIYDLNAV